MDLPEVGRPSGLGKPDAPGPGAPLRKTGARPCGMGGSEVSQGSLALSGRLTGGARECLGTTACLRPAPPPDPEGHCPCPQRPWCSP